LADALGGLVTLIREPRLTVGEATTRGLPDWESITAALTYDGRAAVVY